MCQLLSPSPAVPQCSQQSKTIAGILDKQDWAEILFTRRRNAAASESVLLKARCLSSRGRSGLNNHLALKLSFFLSDKKWIGMQVEPVLLAQDAGKTVADQEDLQSRSRLHDHHAGRCQQAAEQDPGQHHGPVGRPGKTCRWDNGWNWYRNCVHIWEAPFCTDLIGIDLSLSFFKGSG